MIGTGANREEIYMREALKEAQKAYDAGEVPVGCVIVIKNRVIARGYNQVEQLTDATAHAEMIAITSAFNFMGAKFLKDCEIYVTLEPCPMCAGAMYHSQPKKLVFGAQDPKRGYRKYSKELIHPKTEVINGVLADECSDMLTSFFNNLRED